MARSSAVPLSINADNAQTLNATPPTAVHLIHAPVGKMSFEEFQVSRRKLFARKRNRSSIFFNRQGSEFKFCVLTLANKEKAGTFKSTDIGKSFEEFTDSERELIISAMNKIYRWGQIAPAPFKFTDCLINS